MQPLSRLALALLLSAPLPAQAPLFETAGPAGASGYGTRVTGLGDVNGDGKSDIAVADEMGVVRVHSGADWSVLLETAPLNNIISGLGSLDGDGDGVKELVVAHQDSTHNAQLFVDLIDVASGVSRWQYYDFQFIGEPEVRLIDAGDLSGDGLDDLLLGVPDYDLWHPAWWLSGFHALRGTDGFVITAVHYDPPSMGEGLAVVGDIDGDGTPDIAVGAPLDSGGRGLVRAYRTGVGPLLWDHAGATPTSEYGEALVSIGDLDGDGLSELAALETIVVPGGPDVLRVDVLAGATGSVLYWRDFPGEAYPGNLHEVELETLDDLDGDGASEITMAVPRAQWGGPVLRVLASANLATLHQWTDYDHASSILPAAVLTDWDRNGTPDLIVGDPGRGATGWITVLPGDRSVGTQSCGGAVPNSSGLPASLRLAGSSSAARDDLLLLGSELPPTQWILPLAAPQPGFIPHVGGGAGTLCLGGSIRRLLGSIDRADSAGGFWTQLDLSQWHANPTSPILAGETWFFQLWYRDPAGGTTSNLSDAVSVTFD